MKNIIQHEVKETLCDITKEKLEHGGTSIKFSFGYGSARDGDFVDLDVKDKLGEEIFENFLKFVETKYGKKIKVLNSTKW